MTMRKGFAEGEVCWTDLQTRDVEAAKAFYAEVFGWRLRGPAHPGRTQLREGLPGRRPGYRARAAEPPAGSRRGEPGRWNVYFAVDDAGTWPPNWPIPRGHLEFGPEEIGDTGVMVFFAPPGGGTTGAWQAGSHIGAGRSQEPGALAWAELLTPEPQAAVGFFQQLFGHERDRIPPGRRRHLHHAHGGRRRGGRHRPGPRRRARTPLEPGWQVYFGVSDVADAVQAAVAAGGVVLIEPDEVEEAGTIATLKDPQGGVFSLLEV